MQGWNNKKALLKQDELKKKNKYCRTMKNALQGKFLCKRKSIFMIMDVYEKMFLKVSYCYKIL